MRPSGVVKFYDSRKGYGFIKPEAGPDVFVHVSELQKAQIDTLVEGDTLLFDVIAGRDGRPKATAISKVVFKAFD